MRDRLELLRKMLSNDGSIWISIDDDESHYLKVVCDEVFARANFIANVIWQKKFSPQNDAKWLSDMHDHVLVYAMEKSIWRPNLLESPYGGRKRSNLDNDPRGDWISVDYTCNKNRRERPNLYYSIINPQTGDEIWPKETAVWRFNQERHRENERQSLVYWGKDGRNKVPRFKNFIAVDSEGQVPSTIWLHQDVGNTQEARKESIVFNSGDPFATPKPERLLQRVIQIATQPGDLVLDSFAGSGTTGAVAQKMGRRWIMVELGEHCHTHIIPRLKKVIDGDDQGGISKAVNWKGGGGFRYYRLAPSLLEKDRFDNWVISKQYNPAMLAEAICKLEGFAYAPSDTVYWRHGHSTENDFIYVTTQTLGREQLQKLCDEVGEGHSLLVMCGAFRVKNLDDFPNLTVKKIPKAVLNRCEWDKDDYSLEIQNLPMKAREEQEEPETPSGGRKPRSKKERRASVQQPSLFDILDENGSEK